MNTIRPDLPPLPARWSHLPIEARGYPVPWFVAWIDGKSDFRVIREGGITEAALGNKCWLCGGPRGVYSAFVIGPMCAVNRVSSEPPSHRECALYAAVTCPFLTRPMAKRNERDLPTEGVSDPAGHMIKRNPGVTLVWTAQKGAWRPFKTHPRGVLFDVGAPVSVDWFAQGRAATRAEVLESIESGYPALADMARAESPAATRALEEALARALKLVPA